MLRTHFVPWCVADLGACANLLRFIGQRGRSRQSRAMIVSLWSVLARSEAVCDMHFVTLRAMLLHQGSRKGHRPRPTGRSVSGTCMHSQYECYSDLGMDGLVVGCSRTCTS